MTQLCSTSRNYFSSVESEFVCVQTHKSFKRTLIYYDTDTQSANFWSNPLCQATKQHLNSN